VEPGGNEEGERAGGGGGEGGGAGDSNGLEDSLEASRPARGRRTGQAACGIPEVRFTSDPARLDEMRGRAALYIRSDNLVLLNREHFRYQQLLEGLFESVGPDADQRRLAQQLFDEEYMVHAGEYVVQAWLFRGRAEWSDDEFATVLGMGAMTVHLASPFTLVEARRKYNQRMATNRAQTASVN
jgi:hypothetical protein